MTLEEIRVIGSLMEKEVTTPDQCPLSLNALTLACNQKTNRDPVLDFTEETVQSTLISLQDKRYVKATEGFGSRVTKYHQRFCNSEFGELSLSKQEYAVICLLFLRGPQTVGELRSRSQRLHSFTHISEVEATLEALKTRADPLIKELEREPGKREIRFQHCFSSIIEPTNLNKQEYNTIGQLPYGKEESNLSEANNKNEGISRIDVLEHQLSMALDRIITLELEVQSLKNRLDSSK